MPVTLDIQVRVMGDVSASIHWSVAELLLQVSAHCSAVALKAIKTLTQRIYQAIVRVPLQRISRKAIAFPVCNTIDKELCPGIV